MNTKQHQETVTISLPKESISSLLGALRLGIWLENWCANLCMTGIGTYDSHSWRWSKHILNAMDLIKKQTGIQDEFKEYGECNGFLDEMADWVNKQCDQNMKSFEESEKTAHKDDEPSLP